MSSFRMYYSDKKWDKYNVVYEHKIDVDSLKTFIKVIQHDHVPATFVDNRRGNDNFVESNVVFMDCDNGHSDDDKDWVSIDDIKSSFKDVTFYLTYSRNHMKKKDGKSARPRFHLYFPIPTIVDFKSYTDLKSRIYNYFKYFDIKAKDAARFVYATDEPKVEFFEGKCNVLEFIDSLGIGSAEVNIEDKLCTQTITNQIEVDFDDTIEEGSRNATLFTYACKILKRLGDGPESQNLYSEMSERCDPPLGEKELDSIWKSATGYYEKIRKQEDYIPPQEFNKKNKSLVSKNTHYIEEELKEEPIIDEVEPHINKLEPSDYTDVGQAEILVREYGHVLKYSAATGFLYYNGKYWEESATKADSLAQKLTTRQLLESVAAIESAELLMYEGAVPKILSKLSKRKAKEIFNDEQLKAYEDLNKAKAYHKFIMGRRMTVTIKSTLEMVKHMLDIDYSILDQDPFLLNTPKGTYNLKYGLFPMLKHDSKHYLTKCTSIAPSDINAQIWTDTLNKIFLHNTELINYMQKIIGSAVIGKVYSENLIICFGEGSNGKSTFWNVIARVLGTYSGNLSADVLNSKNKQNPKPEIAELKGRRLVIASELNKNDFLDTATIKKLCSTDKIVGEKKYKAPFSFRPSHHLVLCTNHLPQVDATDHGTWRRLIIIPFLARFEGNDDVKNYADKLFNEAGGSILTWIIEGAEMAINENFNFKIPDIVKDLIASHRGFNNSLSDFISQKCTSDNNSAIKSSILYKSYTEYCLDTNKSKLSTKEFKSELIKNGIEFGSKSDGNYYTGLSFK